MRNADIQELTEFLMDYAISMLSVGTYTARVIKCTTRIGKVFGYEVHISIFQEISQLAFLHKKIIRCRGLMCEHIQNLLSTLIIYLY